MKLDVRTPLAVATVIAGTAACLYAGYKAGQKNGIPAIGVKPPLQLPAGTSAVAGAVASGAEYELGSDALELALTAL